MLASILAALTACSPYASINKENKQLALAGFVAHPADTTARWQMMNLLPPNKLAYRLSAQGPILLYADPLACGCVYFGDRQAYNHYVATHKISPTEEKEMQAEINMHPGWDWTAWAPTADPDAVSGLRRAINQPPGWQ
ncbi:hypothetical protein [Brytella acorum]|uniref:Uncharacterized protein n=1 Tax=Brytella acorum TaxID=2959299 RepID=A0AA35UEV7_9PROT|nr:hypothetical protein [Brytella acorum]MDF3624362.1 hypothetical protein [Brytella acorum]CAI9119788.1 hypothetical protein LMG32879_000613 [Brytella acorum]